MIEVEDDAQKEKVFNYGRQLVPYIKRFAVAEGLSPPSGESAGGSYDYRNSAKGILVSLTFGMGERRAVTALFSDQGKNCVSCQAFEEFMRDDVGRDFKVIPCTEIKGFKMPELYNVDLRKE